MAKIEEHNNFKEYKKIIVNHKNFNDLPCRFNANGDITWVKPEKTCPARAKWWDDKVKIFNVASRSDVARLIHPIELNGLKPCHVCGQYMSIFYVYPSANLLKKLNSLSDKFVFKQSNQTIYEIIDILFNEDINYNKLIRKEFKIPLSVNNIDIKEFIQKEYTDKSKKGKLSPGVMSNPPDRLDGFHTYNACCRSTKDTGRHKENMSSYIRDRRAYEFWADGDFVLANNIMGKFNQYKELIKCPICKEVGKPSPDHIGPISLGFSHRPEFQIMCSSCNSSKNNRMTLSDISTLLKDEKLGIEVISWHSKYTWNRIKNLINNDESAKRASRVLRLNMNYILTIFASIYEKNNGKIFLKTFLNPEYTSNKYKIFNFNPMYLNKIILFNKEDKLQEILNNNHDSIPILKTISTAKTKLNSKDDYFRISFDILKQYQDKDNRRIDTKYLSLCEKELNILYSQVEKNDFENARLTLNQVLDFISSKLLMDFKNSSTEI